jgi:hypothetical protein
MAAGRGYAAGHYAVEIEGQIAGYCKSVNGGGITADIAENNLGPALRMKKYATKMAYKDIEIEVGLSHANALLEWMQAAFKMNHQMKNGAVVYFNHNFEAQRRMDWTNGHLIKIVLPKLDAKGKEGLYVTLTIKPEHVEYSAGGGKVNPTIGQKMKQHIATNFSVDIPGLDTSHMMSLELPTFELKVAEHAVGLHNESQFEPAAAKLGDWKCKFSAAQYKNLYDDARSFLVLGERSESVEKRCAINILAPNTKDVTVEINLENCGYKEVVLAGKNEANKEEIAACEVTWYTEFVDLKIPQKDM